MKKTNKRIVIGLGALVFVLMALLTGGSFYLVGYALQPEVKNLDSTRVQMCRDYPQLGAWLDSLEQVKALRDTFITASDGIRLHAVYVRAAQPTDRTAVLVHGYTDNHLRMFHIGYLYSHDLGYNIWVPDLRHSGKSGGDYIQMGWNDRLDVLRWMEIANTVFRPAQGKETQMVVHGISMGAATTMMVSGEPQQPYVKCFVEDCGYTSVWDEYCGEIKNQFNLPAFPLLYASDALCKLKYGWSFREASALNQVKKCTLPMLFIHGTADTFVPTWMVHPLYEAKPGAKELWLSEGVKHAASYKKYPEEYTRRVRRFTSQYIH